MNAKAQKQISWVERIFGVAPTSTPARPKVAPRQAPKNTETYIRRAMARVGFEQKQIQEWILAFKLNDADGDTLLEANPQFVSSELADTINKWIAFRKEQRKPLLIAIESKYGRKHFAKLSDLDIAGNIKEYDAILNGRQILDEIQKLQEDFAALPLTPDQQEYLLGE